MSETLHILETRRSCRAYLPDAVPGDILQAVLQAGTYAPTGMGRQSPIILAVTNRAVRDRLSALNAQVMGQSQDFDPFYGAPVVLVVLADRSVPTYLYDGSLVMGNLMLAAQDLGLGSCWIHRAKEVFASPDGQAILRDLGIQGDYEGIGHCILGYPASAEAPQPAPRKENYIYYIK
jgi:nitroreductase